MHAFEVADIQQELRQKNKRYLEFFCVPALSMGVYELATGSRDLQQPHGEDEIYYVVSGKAIIRVGTEDRAISPGSVIYVAAREIHYFHSITEDLSLLVFFAPAEGAEPPAES